LEKKVHFSPLKTLEGRQYSFQKLAQFSQGNDVLHAPASNVLSLLSRDTCMSPTQLNKPIWIKMSVSPPWKPWWAGNIPF
jgi:hypothetical protein